MHPRVARLAELRRSLPLVAAGLLLVALVFPVWRITLEAPQYTRSLVVEAYVYPHLTGDVAEVAGLNSYVGFYFPDPVYVDPAYDVHENAIAVPEWILGPVGYIGVAIAGAFVAFAPTERKLKRGLTAQLVGTIAVFTVMFAIIQYRLYQAGHSLDPDAPLTGVSAFTPPVLGTYEVANINGLAWFGPGGYLTMLAVGLLVVAFLLRDTTATLRDLPALLRAIPGKLRARLRRIRPVSGDGSGTDGDPSHSSDDRNESAERELQS